MTQLSLQDFYNQLDEGDRAYAQEQAEEIKQIANNAATQIGQKLIKVKQRLGRGKFLTWIQKEFEWSDRQARRLMTIASEFSNWTHVSDLPQGIRTAYALASALAKESEEGKEELVEEYQEKLEEKQLATPEDEEPPKSLTEKEIKELVKERNKLKAERDGIQATLDDLQNTMDERINEEVEEKTKKEREKLEAKIENLKNKLENKEEELNKELEKFKAHPDPETSKKIKDLKEEHKNLEEEHDNIKLKVTKANQRLKDAQERKDQKLTNLLAVKNFLDELDALFKEHSKITTAIESPYIDDAHEEKFIELRNTLYHYADSIDKAIKRRGENPSEVTVDVEPL